MKKMTQTQIIILILLSLTALCLCALFLALIPSVSLPASNSPPTATIPPQHAAPTAPAIPTPLRHRAAGAIIQCRQFIRDRLVSPSSAEFSHEEAYKVNDEPMNYHAVVGVVESKNRMGVSLRSQYRCDLHYSPDDPMSWVLDYLDIDD